MTYRRRAGSVEAGTHTALQELAPDMVERATGVTTKVLYDASNPTKKHQLSFKHAAALDAALKAAGRAPIFAPMFDSIVAERLAVLGLLTPAKPCDPRDLMLEIGKEIGDMSAAVRQAIADGTIETSELESIERQARDVIGVCERMIANCRTEASKGADVFALQRQDNG